MSTAGPGSEPYCLNALNCGYMWNKIILK